MNKEYYVPNRKFYQRVDQMRPIYDERSKYDIRFIVLRHAERVDQTIGQNWYQKIFGDGPSAPRSAYRHPLLPQQLPYRVNSLLYEFDPPITRRGEDASFLKGQALSRAGAVVDYCYASPASRSVLTANAILKGMNHSHIPIRIEPNLFEPMGFNKPLQLLTNMYPFMSRGDWAQAGYNVDRLYQRLGNELNPNETEVDYFDRSQLVFDSIERRYNDRLPLVPVGAVPRRRITILVVGHSTSTEIFSTVALRKRFDTKTFNEQHAKVPYLHAVVIERDAINRAWYIRPQLADASMYVRAKSADAYAKLRKP